MGNNANKDKWVDEVLESLNGMQRIPASPNMYENVMNRIATSKQVGSNSSVLIKRVAAAAILLFVINLASILHVSHKKSTPQQTNIYQVVNEQVGYLSEDSY